MGALSLLSSDQPILHKGRREGEGEEMINQKQLATMSVQTQTLDGREHVFTSPMFDDPSPLFCSYIQGGRAQIFCRRTDGGGPFYLNFPYLLLRVHRRLRTLLIAPKKIECSRARRGERLSTRCSIRIMSACTSSYFTSSSAASSFLPKHQS